MKFKKQELIVNNTNFLHADTFGTTNTMDSDVLRTCENTLKRDGWVLLRGFDHNITIFSELVAHYCSKLTFDPARQYCDKSTQKVDAGTGAIGLHIENGNTPFPPDLVGFYSKKSANFGSQTTICDGSAVFQALSDELKLKFSQTLTVSRTLPEQLWKSYAVNEHPAINNIDEVDASHIDEILAVLPNHRGRLNEDGSLYYQLDISPVIASQLSNQIAFANAILGPSLNYEAPHYKFADGSDISAGLKQELESIAEEFTLEISWRDGDMTLIDNKRVMHGRRAISDQANRELYIGMGLLAA